MKASLRTTAIVAALITLSGVPAACRTKSEAPAAAASARAAGVCTPILGEPQVSPERMWEFVSAVNSDFPIEIARAYYDVGMRYGVRGDIALCQAIVETGWFRFTGGTAVTADQHNYCGMGVIQRGMKGHSFDSIEQGVTAQIQHLYAYACRQSLPPGEQLIDPRFKMVSRGIAPAWEDLSLRWAANARYGESILALFNKMACVEMSTVEEIGIEIPEELMNE
ncbi:MAG: glucosaminidase domain-containing protein [Paramuribaculum sp.]|nr:glucosaminidase domain-containing protein [Paramuribaculum sp.]